MARKPRVFAGCRREIKKRIGQHRRTLRRATPAARRKLKLAIRELSLTDQRLAVLWGTKTCPRGK